MALPEFFYVMAQRDADFHLQVEIIHGSRAEDADFGERGHGFFEVVASTRRIFRGDRTLRLGDEVKFEVYISEEVLYAPMMVVHPRDFDNAHYMEVFLVGDPPDCSVPYSLNYLIEELTAVPTVKIRLDLLPPALREPRLKWMKKRASELLKRFLQKLVGPDEGNKP
jgi:hypothetical protein